MVTFLTACNIQNSVMLLDVSNVCSSYALWSQMITFLTAFNIHNLPFLDMDCQYIPLTPRLFCRTRVDMLSICRIRLNYFVIC
jgi:hypothetical protein